MLSCFAGFIICAFTFLFILVYISKKPKGIVLQKKKYPAIVLLAVCTVALIFTAFIFAYLVPFSYIVGIACGVLLILIIKAIGSILHRRTPRTI